MKKVAINGFGRIGRNLFKLLLEKDVHIIGVNDVADIETMAHLLKYDSIHGRIGKSVEVKGSVLVVDGKEIPYTQFATPAELTWSPDVVYECSGRYRTAELLRAHLKNDHMKVILSVPATDNLPMMVMGVKEDVYSERILSNASCTTNSAAPLLKVLMEKFGVSQAYVSTIHSYTSDQRLHDAPHKDLRRSRAAAESIIPTTTGAAKALTKIFPELGDNVGGCGIRVPVPNGSLTDLTVIVKEDTTIEEVNAAFKAAAEGELKGIVEYTNDPIVSVDIIGNPHSSIFDAGLTSVIGKMVKVVGWYDNESGYSNRLADLIDKL